MVFSKYTYDVFISHAVEDKIAIANDLCKRLEEAGLRIWYSGKELKVGDSIEASIRTNLSQSKYAVVIFSQHYLSKNWPMKEFYLLLSHEIAQRKVILPVLYEVTVDDLKQKDISMADKFAIPFSKGMDYVVEKLVEEIKGVKPPPKKAHIPAPLKRNWIIASAVIVLVLASAYFGYAFYTAQAAPGQTLIEQAINQRISSHQAKLEKEQRLLTSTWQAVPANPENITAAFARFVNLKSYYRNDYEFTNGYREIRFKKNVEAALQVSLEGLSPYNAYGFTQYEMASTAADSKQAVIFSYAYTNVQPLQYSIIRSQWLNNGDYEVQVAYTHNIRNVIVTLTFPQADSPKRCEVVLQGYLPIERYIFHQHESSWTWTALE